MKPLLNLQYLCKLLNVSPAAMKNVLHQLDFHFQFFFQGEGEVSSRKCISNALNPQWSNILVQTNTNHEKEQEKIQ